MQLYDDPTTVATPPALPAAGTPGYFTDGVPGGQPRTIVRGWWLNLVAQELLAIVVAAGITPARNTTNQVLQAIRSLISTAIGALPSSYPPSGAAGGDLTGSYPNPTLAAVGGLTPGAYASPKSVTVDAKGRVTAIAAGAPITLGNAASGCRWDPRDGYFEQWGENDTAITTEGTVTVTYPWTFDTCIQFAGWALDPGSTTGCCSVQPGAYSATSGVLRFQDDQGGSVATAGGYRWSAKGFRATAPS